MIVCCFQWFSVKPVNSLKTNSKSNLCTNTELQPATTSMETQTSLKWTSNGPQMGLKLKINQWILILIVHDVCWTESNIMLNVLFQCFCFNVLHYFSMCLACLFIMLIDVQCVFVIFHCCFLNLFPYVPLFSWIFIVFLCNSLFSLVVQCVSWFFMFQRFSLFLLLFSMFLFFSF